MPKPWQTYEEVAAHFLNEFPVDFGFAIVEGKQIIPGRLYGTSWEIDAKGVKEGNQGFTSPQYKQWIAANPNCKFCGRY